MRNTSLPLNDQTPVSRAPSRRYVWVKLFGRDWVLKRHKPTLLGIVGAALATLGVVGLTWGSVRIRFRPDLIGITLIIVATIMICYGRLQQRNLGADEIYKVAHERGKEEGYDEGYEDRGMEQPIRPVVVALPDQCAHGTRPHMVPAGR